MSIALSLGFEQRVELGPAQVDVLNLARESAISAAEVASARGISLARACIILSGLVDAGLMRREGRPGFYRYRKVPR